jgi:hypothetical protein
MGTKVDGLFVVPAWCDPESRNYRLSWHDTLIGLLVVDDERFIFATPSGVKFNVPRSESSLEWRRGKAFGMIPRFDLLTPQGSFRLYLSRPSTTAPLYNPSVAAQVADALNNVGGALNNLSSLVGIFFLGVAHAISGVGAVASITADVMSAREDYRAVRQGRAAARALSLKISSPPLERPSPQ